jgi:hypothetical protein
VKADSIAALIDKGLRNKSKRGIVFRFETMRNEPLGESLVDVRVGRLRRSNA